MEKYLKAIMITLWAILVLVAFVAGIMNSHAQEDTIYIPSNYNPDDTANNIFTDFATLRSDTIQWEMKVNFHLMLSDLEDYRQMCHDDSTETEFDWYLTFEGELHRSYPRFDPGHYPNYQGRWTDYIHREPTFIGFADWIIKKHRQTTYKITNGKD